LPAFWYRDAFPLRKGKRMRDKAAGGGEGKNEVPGIKLRGGEIFKKNEK